MTYEEKKNEIIQQMRTIKTDADKYVTHIQLKEQLQRVLDSSHRDDLIKGMILDLRMFNSLIKECCELVTEGIQKIKEGDTTGAVSVLQLCESVLC